MKIQRIIGKHLNFSSQHKWFGVYQCNKRMYWPVFKSNLCIFWKKLVWQKNFYIKKNTCNLEGKDLDFSFVRHFNKYFEWNNFFNK